MIRPVVLLAALVCYSTPTHSHWLGTPAPVGATARTLSFVPLDKPSAFLARGAYSARLEAHRVVLNAGRGAPLEMSLEGADPAASGTVLEPLTGRENHFFGNRPEHWRTGIRTFGRVRYQSVYRGIDVEYYAAGQQLECDFIVAPGASPNAIRFRFRSARSVRRDSGGILVMNTAGQVLRVGKPHIYQLTPVGRSLVFGEYELLGGHRAAIRLGTYDAMRPLIIDPVITFSTYLGGSGDENVQSVSDPRVAGIAVDAQGNSYVVGNTASPDFPTGGAQPSGFNGSTDVFLSKFSPDGGLVYSTFIGGSGLERGFGVAVDRTGAAYVAGRTQSRNFPLRNPAQASLGGREDAFVLKLDASGSVILYSTFLGGSGVDFATGIAVDFSGNAWVTGDAESFDFPLRGDSLQNANRGGTSDGFVAKLGSDGQLVYTTYLGGWGFDHCEAVAVDSGGNAYLTGYAAPASFPAGTDIGPAARPTALRRAFAVKLRSDGSLVYSTMLGGTRAEMGMGIAVDSAGNAHITGITWSADFPVTKGALQSAFGGGSMDGFVAAIKPDGVSLLFATYLGGEADDQPTGIALDASANPYVTGQTNSTRFPLSQAFQTALRGSMDGFVARLSSGGEALLYSSYLGGTGADLGQGIAAGPDGGVWVMGTTTSADFPTLNASQPRMAGGRSEAFVVRLKETPPVDVVSAASYVKGAVAPDSIASAWGQELALGLESAPGLPLPTSLAGSSVKVRDSAGVERLAPLFFVSPGQVNFLVPAQAVPGRATIEVSRSGRDPVTGGFEIARTAPGLFSANADGRGVAAAVAIYVAADGSQTSEIIYTCSASGCASTPLSLGDAPSQLILLLFGTGIRGFGALPSASIGGEQATVLGAAAQGQYPGLDQVNVAVPRSLAGRGEVDILLTVDGRAANPVKVNIR